MSNKVVSKSNGVHLLYLISWLIIFSIGFLVFELNNPIAYAHHSSPTPTPDDMCYECPSMKFEAERYICPEGYPKESKKHEGYCYKGNKPDWPEDYKEMVKEEFSIEFQYDKDAQDPHKCHKPTPESLNIPSWARGEFGRLDEWKKAEVIVCPIPSPDPTITPTPTPVDTSTPTPTDSPTPEPTDTPTPDPEVTPDASTSPEPEATDSPTPEPTDSPSPTPTPSDGGGDNNDDGDSDSGGIGGSSDDTQGEVLGATTLADTGTINEVLGRMLSVIGLILVSISAHGYTKVKREESK